jgi:hypothetical protein
MDTYNHVSPIRRITAGTSISKVWSLTIFVQSAGLV